MKARRFRATENWKMLKSPAPACPAAVGVTHRHSPLGKSTTMRTLRLVPLMVAVMVSSSGCGGPEAADPPTARAAVPDTRPVEGVDRDGNKVRYDYTDEG